MHVKMILPALTEARSPHFRPIKYSLFPPLGLATLAGYLRPDDHVEIQDEHVERLNLGVMINASFVFGLDHGGEDGIGIFQIAHQSLFNAKRMTCSASSFAPGCSSATPESAARASAAL